MAVVGDVDGPEGFGGGALLAFRRETGTSICAVKHESIDKY